MTLPAITVETTKERTVFHLSGSLITESLDTIDSDFAQIAPATNEAHIDLSGLEALDTGGAWLIVRLRQRLARDGVTLRLDGASEDRLRFIETITSAPMEAEAEAPGARGLRQSVEALGARVVQSTSAAGSPNGSTACSCTRCSASACSCSSWASSSSPSSPGRTP